MTGKRKGSVEQVRRELGGRLREVRRAAGLTGRQLAAATGQHFTRVSKIENGVQAPTERDVREWCAACAAADQEAELIAVLRVADSASVESRRESRAGMRRVLGAHTLKQYEKTDLFRIYEHNMIPGLFQTAEYSAAILSFWISFLRAPNDVDQAVAVRMERRQVLQLEGKRFVVVLEEQALRTLFGSAETQVGQLGHLLELMSLPHISLGIIPLMTERTGVGATGFWMFDDSLVALETPTASIQVTQPSELGLYARMFDALQDSAVYGKEARALIVGVLNEIDA
ncbi:helix-turn-helix domain-containing protein [Nocardia sp. NPDC049149]|uniref:helix-turn-helix domain-containing protein n=1 Tax=Nocardia sp. NPDC049149 TaxID=3364315 RepID=UPI003712B249